MKLYTHSISAATAKRRSASTSGTSAARYDDDDGARAAAEVKAPGALDAVIHARVTTAGVELTFTSMSIWPRRRSAERRHAS